jgi:predicted transcriptional regulator
MAEVLEILNDGHWHSIDDIRAKTNLNAKQSKKIIEFLKAYEFVAVDQKQNRVKIKETVRKFLTQKVTS